MPPSQRTIDALAEALDDEYLACATYRKVIEAFGPVRPFINIVEAEQRHADALLELFRHYGVTPPGDQWEGRVIAPATLEAACRAAVEAEIRNVEMYDRLLAAVDDPAARQVLQRLQEASQLRHLPAFRRCLDRISSGGRGAGGRRAGGGYGHRGGRGRGRAT